MILKYLAFFVVTVRNDSVHKEKNKPPKKVAKNAQQTSSFASKKSEFSSINL